MNRIYFIVEIILLTQEFIDIEVKVQVYSFNLLQTGFGFVSKNT